MLIIFVAAFLYNKRENQIVSYIDYIDPVQGKIAGPADQEITFKTPFDPAVYNTGNNQISSVDPNRAWSETARWSSMVEY